jgi:rhodanese-related sulfurtransferase
MEQVLRTFTLNFFGKGKHNISPDTFFEMKNAYLLDVRSKEEASSISIKLEYHLNVGCENIPINEIPDRIHEIPKDKSIAVFCSGITRSAIAYAYLLSKGFRDVHILENGYLGLTNALKPGKVLKIIQGKNKK